MAESLVQVTEGVGKKLHSWSRVSGANTVEDEVVIVGEYPWPTYWITADAVSIATAAAHVLQIMAGASLIVRLKRLVVKQVGNATTAGTTLFDLWRLSTAGTGGTAITPAKADTADVAAGATAMALPTVKGTELTLLRSIRLDVRQAFLTTSTQVDDVWEWIAPPNSKGLIIPAGAANGLALKATPGSAGATVNVFAEIAETPFL